jgi:acetyl esterase/lipase
LDARLYTPERGGRNAEGLIVFFPCGGFVSCDLEQGEPIMRMIAERTGWNVLVTCYTLPAEQPFPAAVEDAHAVLAWTVRHRAALGWDGKCLVSAGVEAGGNLAAVSALMARDRGGPMLTAQVLIMPMLDPGLTSCSMRVADTDGAARAASECAAGYRDYLPRAIDRTHPYASPLQSSRMQGLPPALILSADDDPLRDEAELYGARLKEAGGHAAVKRLSALPLEKPDARHTCVRQEDALRELESFLASLKKPGRR